MKKLLSLAAVLVVSTAHAQYEINFDNMEPGLATPQSPLIVLWPPRDPNNPFDPPADDGYITAEDAFSPPHSMLIKENPGRAIFTERGIVNAPDVLFNLGNKKEGVWSLEWMMKIPTGRTAFWNIQEYEGAAPYQWNGQFFAGRTEFGGLADHITFDQSATAFVFYPADIWFKVVMTIDLDNKTMSVWVNGRVMVDKAPYQAITLTELGVPAVQLGSINFYSIDLNNRYYVDNFRLVAGTLPPGEPVGPEPPPPPTLDVAPLAPVAPPQTLPTTPGLILPGF